MVTSSVKSLPLEESKQDRSTVLSTIRSIPSAITGVFTFEVLFPRSSSVISVGKALAVLVTKFPAGTSFKTPMIFIEPVELAARFKLPVN